jgi:hypothetical protein
MSDVSWLADKKNKLRRAASRAAHKARGERPVVVSLTSYPSRINTVWQSVRTLFGQTRLPDKTVLYLAKSDFPNREADLPELLTSMLWHDFEIRWVDQDLKSHKKYHWAFKEFEDCLVVTVDDDLLYRKTMIEELVTGYKDHPGCVVASRGHLINFNEDGSVAPYDAWISEVGLKYPVMLNVPSMRLFATTGAGTLFDPKLLPDITFDAELACELCLHADDIWLKFCETVAGIPTVFITSQQGCDCVPETQAVGLWATLNSQGGNDRAIRALLGNEAMCKALPGPFEVLVRDDDLDARLK